MVCISNTCGGLWSNEVGQNWETDKDHDEDCVEECFSWRGFQKVKFDIDGEGGRKALGMGNGSIDI